MRMRVVAVAKKTELPELLLARIEIRTMCASGRSRGQPRAVNTRAVPDSKVYGVVVVPSNLTTTVSVETSPSELVTFNSKVYTPPVKNWTRVIAWLGSRT